MSSLWTDSIFGIILIFVVVELDKIRRELRKVKMYALEK